MFLASHHGYSGWTRTLRGWCALGIFSLERDPAKVRLLRHAEQAQRWILSKALEDRLAVMRRKNDEILTSMRSSGHAPASYSQNEVVTIMRAVKLLDKRDELEEEEKQLKDLLQESSGVDEMEKECHDELHRNRSDLIALETKILDAILPQDEDDYSSDAVVEVRAGTGGDEASLFASELFEAYSNSASRIGFKVEILDASRSEIGGLKEGSMLISGGAIFRPSFEANEDSGMLFGPYGTFKFESGVHRVQRVRLAFLYWQS